MLGERRTAGEECVRGVLAMSLLDFQLVARRELAGVLADAKSIMSGRVEDIIQQMLTAHSVPEVTHAHRRLRVAARDGYLPKTGDLGDGLAHLGWALEKAGGGFLPEARGHLGRCLRLLRLAFVSNERRMNRRRDGGDMHTDYAEALRLERECLERLGAHLSPR